MKKSLLLLTLVIMAFATQAQKEPMNAIKINPLSLLVKTGNLSYERATFKNQSFQFGGFFSSLTFDEVGYKGFGITPEYRFYIAANKTALNGVYVSPFVRYQNYSLSEKGTDNKLQIDTKGGGVTAGWQKSWESGLLLNFFAGPSYNLLTIGDGNQNNIDIKSGFNGFGIRSGISLGISF